MHAELPTVYRLPVHLPDQQMIYFGPDDDVNEILEHGSSKKTTLTEFFVANSKYPAARNITYQEFPQSFTWNKTAKKWTPRKQGFAIGRMYFASPSAGEQFYLCTLLTVVKGAQSFEELRTVDGHLHVTFKAACLAQGLFEDNNEWIQCGE